MRGIHTTASVLIPPFFEPPMYPLPRHHSNSPPAEARNDKKLHFLSEKPFSRPFFGSRWAHLGPAGRPTTGSFRGCPSDSANGPSSGWHTLRGLSYLPSHFSRLRGFPMIPVVASTWRQQWPTVSSLFPPNLRTSFFV